MTCPHYRAIPWCLECERDERLGVLPSHQFEEAFRRRAAKAMHGLLIRAFCSGATDLYLCGDKGSLHAIGLDECQPPWG